MQREAPVAETRSTGQQWVKYSTVESLNFTGGVALLRQQSTFQSSRVVSMPVLAASNELPEYRGGACFVLAASNDLPEYKFGVNGAEGSV